MNKKICKAKFSMEIRYNHFQHGIYMIIYVHKILSNLTSTNFAQTNLI